MPHQAVHGLRELVHSLHVLLAPSVDARKPHCCPFVEQEGYDTYWL